MASHGNEVSEIAQRYAGALFDLAREKNQLADVEQGLDAFVDMVHGNAEIRRLVRSPVIAASEQRSAMERIVSDMHMTGLSRDFLLLLAKNRRLFIVDAVVSAYKARASKERGEVEADVVSAVPLTAPQLESLTDGLRAKLGKTPKLKLTVDKSLLGGMIVKVGSQMVDTSLRTKLKTLEIAMREAV